MTTLATNIVKTLKEYQAQLEADRAKGKYWTYQHKGYKQRYEDAVSSGNRTLNCIMLYNWILRTLCVIPDKGLINCKNGKITYANAEVKKAAQKYFDEIKMGDTQINLAKKGKLQKGDLCCHNAHFSIFVKYENGKLITGDAGRGNCSPVAVGGKFKKFYGESPCPNDVVTYVLRPKDSVTVKTEAVVTQKGDDNVALTGNTNEEKIWNYLLDKIGNEYGVASLMGNLFAESGLDPTSVEMLLVQRLDEDKTKYPNISWLQGWKRPVDNEANRTANNKKYVKLLDDGIITKEEFLHPRSYTGKQWQYGFCLHQITSPNRKEKFYDFIKSKGKSFGNLNLQLQYLIKELKSDYPFVWSALKNAKSVKEASDVVLTKFEIPADCSTSVKNLRASYGQEYYNKYASNKKTSTSSNTSQSSSLSLTKAESAIQWMEKTANDNSHGYDQLYRWNEKGDYDCSSAVFTAWEQAGVKIKSYSLNNYGCAYTGSMYQTCLNNGFKDVTSQINLATGSGLMRSDILLNHKNHVAMYCGNGKEVEASINEYGTATGGKPGDQTGSEFLIKNYRNYPWDCVLRYKDASALATTTSSSNTTQTSSKPTSTTSKGSHTVIADSLNVRTWAGTTYPQCSFSPLKEGAKVNVEYTIDAADGTGGKWSLIEYNGLKGFVLTEWIE